MHGRPDLAGLSLTSRSSVYTVGSDSDSGSGLHLFFTPSNNKEKIYKRLAERIHLLLEYDTPFTSSMHGEKQLLELCAGMWDIREKTALQLDAAAELWKASVEKAQIDEERVGVNRSPRNAVQQIQLEQNGWAQRVVEAMKELEQEISSGLDDKTVSLHPAAYPAGCLICFSFYSDNRVPNPWRIFLPLFYWKHQGRLPHFSLLQPFLLLLLHYQYRTSLMRYSILEAFCPYIRSHRRPHGVTLPTNFEPLRFLNMRCKLRFSYSPMAIY